MRTPTLLGPRGRWLADFEGTAQSHASIDGRGSVVIPDSFVRAEEREMIEGINERVPAHSVCMPEEKCRPTSCLHHCTHRVGRTDLPIAGLSFDQGAVSAASGRANPKFLRRSSERSLFDADARRRLRGISVSRSGQGGKRRILQELRAFERVSAPPDSLLISLEQRDPSASRRMLWMDRQPHPRRQGVQAPVCRSST